MLCRAVLGSAEARDQPPAWQIKMLFDGAPSPPQIESFRVPRASAPVPVCTFCFNQLVEPEGCPETSRLRSKDRGPCQAVQETVRSAKSYKETSCLGSQGLRTCHACAGDCPLCMREVNMLRRRDEGVGKIGTCRDDQSVHLVAPQNHKQEFYCRG